MVPVVMSPTASAHAGYKLHLTLVSSGSINWNPFVNVYYEIYKQTWYETTGYVVFISTHRIQHYLAELDNRISFVGGIEYGGNCPDSTYIGYTPRNGQTTAQCSNWPFGDRVGSGSGHFEITPGSVGTWRTLVSGATRQWWREGGYTASWSDLNVARAGYSLTSGDRIDLSVWYHFTIYYVFWWEHHYRGTQYWSYTIP